MINKGCEESKIINWSLMRWLISMARLDLQLLFALLGLLLPSFYLSVQLCPLFFSEESVGLIEIAVRF